MAQTSSRLGQRPAYVITCDWRIRLRMPGLDPDNTCTCCRRWRRPDCSVADLCDGPQFLRRGRSKAEELEIGWNLFEQHIGPDLNLAAARFCRCQKWCDFLLHHNLTHES